MRSLLSSLGLFAALLSLWAGPAQARDRFLSDAPLWLPKGVDASALEQVLKEDLVGFLRAYKPAGYGDKITGYTVMAQGKGATGKMNFVTSTLLGTEKVPIKFTAQPVQRITCAGTRGFRLEFDLTGSDARVVREAKTWRIDLCLSTDKHGALKLNARSTMLNGAGAEDVKLFLRGQHWPLLEGLRKRLGHGRIGKLISELMEFQRPDRPQPACPEAPT